MSPTAPGAPAGWRRLAGLIALHTLSRKGRLAMSPSIPETTAPRDHAGGRDADRHARHGDTAPGANRDEGESVWESVRTYLIGLGLAALLTACSFALSYTDLVYGPVVPVALVVFAIAQVGVHLVFFLHLTTSPDNINNAMALAFGTLIVFLLIGGTLWIMMHMNENMMPMPGTPAGHAMPMKDMPMKDMPRR